jgi:hypothetical protein
MADSIKHTFTPAKDYGTVPGSGTAANRPGGGYQAPEVVRQSSYEQGKYRDQATKNGGSREDIDKAMADQMKIDVGDLDVDGEKNTHDDRIIAQATEFGLKEAQRYQFNLIRQNPNLTQTEKYLAARAVTAELSILDVGENYGKDGVNLNRPVLTVPPLSSWPKGSKYVENFAGSNPFTIPLPK